MTPQEGAASGSSGFAALLSGIQEPTEYAVASGREQSQTYRIAVIEALRATGYQKRVTFPAYTGLAPQQELATDGNLSAMVG